ncbi:hypothetical protein BC830DRAFT_1253477 [Chytriomyces sp. MP71]|nr:hypothetical protein BC830DRAFT_1253477 [Chytriomyces sp. MP71]
MKDFNGARADRFPKLPFLNKGPASYDCDQATTLSKNISSKPSSILGVCVTTAERFPELRKPTPAPSEYKPKTFVQALDTRVTSHREVLNSTYDPNYAIGRHVGNDNRFALVKSTRLKNRDLENKRQIHDLRNMLNTPDIFTDKRACRRMAHLALYFPA